MEHFRDLSHSERLRRLAGRTSDEAKKANEIGKAYDETAEEQQILETAMSDPETAWPVLPEDDLWGVYEWNDETAQSIDDLEASVHRLRLSHDLIQYLAARGDVLDAGSVDTSLIEDELGVDVCVDPDFLNYVIDRAKQLTGSDTIRTEDMVRARQDIETEALHAKDTMKALKKLKRRGIDEDELLELLKLNPKKLRSYARLSESPALAGFMKDVKSRARGGEVLSLDEFISGALMTIYAQNEFQLAVDSGDQEATELFYLQGTVDETAAAALGDLALHHSQPDILSQDVPDPQEEFTDIPPEI